MILISGRQNYGSHFLFLIAPTSILGQNVPLGLFSREDWRIINLLRAKPRLTIYRKLRREIGPALTLFPSLYSCPIPLPPTPPTTETLLVRKGRDFGPKRSVCGRLKSFAIIIYTD